MEAKFEQGARSATAHIALEQPPLEAVESFESTGAIAGRVGQDDFVSNFGSHLDDIINR